MPVKVRKNRTEVKTIDGEEISLNMYDVLVFQKFENYLIFYFATMGWSNTLEYFGVGQYIRAVPTYDEDPRYMYIKVSSTLYIRVLKSAMASDYVQSMLGNICNLCNNRLNYDDIENKEMWTIKIGGLKQNAAKESHYELGKRYIILFNRMLDKGTIESLRLTNFNKRDVYAIIRWVVQNYNALWKKDNLNILNKRLRCTEFVAASLNEGISERIKRFVNTSANTKEKAETKYKQFFAYRGTEVIAKLHWSGLMRFDESVNDADLFLRLKVTSKEVSSSGNKSDNKTVSAIRRGLDPSHLGRFDINFCSSSDPGLTNYLTLGCRTDGMYFEGAEPEPETAGYDLKRELGELDDEARPIVIIDPYKYNMVLDAVSRCHIRTCE